jgi:hypothetical protein
MALPSFRAAPRKGHLDWVKCVCGCLSKFQHAVMRFCAEEPDHSDLPNQDFKWCHTACGEAKEATSKDAPEPLGKPVVTACVDANLFHDMLAGRSVTSVLHLVNKTPADWFAEKQAAGNS